MVIWREESGSHVRAIPHGRRGTRQLRALRGTNMRRPGTGTAPVGTRMDVSRQACPTGVNPAPPRAHRSFASPLTGLGQLPMGDCDASGSPAAQVSVDHWPDYSISGRELAAERSTSSSSRTAAFLGGVDGWGPEGDAPHRRGGRGGIGPRARPRPGGTYMQRRTSLLPWAPQCPGTFCERARYGQTYTRRGGVPRYRARFRFGCQEPCYNHSIQGVCATHC